MERHSLPISFPSLVVIVVCSLLWHCGKKEYSATKETIIARIGDKTISQDEFIRRAEYTIRPGYCRGDDYVQRKIVLNSLVAEKLLALEAGEDNDLTRTEEFQLYLQGRQEQAMRQWLYYKEAYAKVTLDSNEVRKHYNITNRKYKIAYYAIPDSGTARLVRTQLQDEGRSFEEVFMATASQPGAIRARPGLPQDGLPGQGTARRSAQGPYGPVLGQGPALGPVRLGIPQREVAWDSPEHEVVHEALFSGVLEKNQVIGPLKVDDSDYVVMKIMGWIESVSISDTQIQRRWRDVLERLTHKQAGALLDNYVAKLMRGKRVEFSPQTFRKLVNIVGPYYLKAFEEKQAAFHQRLWKNEEIEISFNQMGKEIEAILDEPLFRLDGKVWTVRDLEREMKIHPLVFRKKRMQKSEFAEQLKLAIADMIRDRHISQDAYKKGYHEVDAVKQNVEMWKDNLLFLYQLNKHLKAIGKQENFNKEYVKIIETELNPYVDSLQAKYSNKIEINTDAFEKIKLTKIDMLVLQRNVPFPIVVPSFPVITTDPQLDYGRKTNNLP